MSPFLLRSGLLPLALFSLTTLLVTGCGIAGGTRAQKILLHPDLGAAPLAHHVAVGMVGARPEAGVNRAIGAYNFGTFDKSDVTTLRRTLELSLPSATGPDSRLKVNVWVQHFGQTFTNNRGACLALIDWCVTDSGSVVASERFYAAYDTGDKVFGTESVGAVKTRVLHAAAARIAERSLAITNGLPPPIAPDLTFDDPASATATLPTTTTAVGGAGAVQVAVQQTMLGGLTGAIQLLPEPIPPTVNWSAQLNGNGSLNR